MIIAGLFALLFLVCVDNFTEAKNAHVNRTFIFNSTFALLTLGLFGIVGQRLLSEQFALPLVYHAAAFLILIPDLTYVFLGAPFLNHHKKNVKALKESENLSEEVSKTFEEADGFHKGKDYDYPLFLFFSLLSVLMPEFLILSLMFSIRHKTTIGYSCPMGLTFSKTDQYLHPIVMCFLGIQAIFYTLGLGGNLFAMAGCLGWVAGCYTKAGLEKMKFDWVERNRLIYLKKSAENQLGWNVLPDKLVLIIEKYSVFIFFLEAMSIFLMFPLSSLSVTITLSVVILFHITVLLASGINFWKWKIALLTIILMFLFSPEYVLAIESIIFYLACFVYAVNFSLSVPKLGWLDSPISTRYSISVKSEDTDWILVNPYWLSPFDLFLSQNRCNHLVLNDMNFFSYEGCLGAIRSSEDILALRSLSELNTNTPDDIIIEKVNNLIVTKGKKIFHNDYILGTVFLNWLVGNITTASKFSKSRQILSNLCSHIRNGYEEKYDFENLRSLKRISKIKIEVERKFWREDKKVFISMYQAEYQCEAGPLYKGEKK